MTYKEIINRFRQVVEEHKQLQDFGYGELSDLKTQSQLGPEEQGVDYPYLFLLPTPSVRQGPVMEYSFNMIVMDMARGEEGDKYDNYITIQSDCQQYIDDVLARLYFYYTDQPEVTLTGITYTPFKEKYQDELAGMTATITIEVPTPIDECNTPFDTWVLEDTLDVRVLEGTGYNYQNIRDQWPIPEQEETYKIEWDFRVENTIELIPDSSPYNVPYFTIFVEADTGKESYYFEQAYPSNQGIHTITGTTEITAGDIPPDSRDFFFGLGYLGTTYPNGEPLTYYPNSTALLGGTIKIYKRL